MNVFQLKTLFHVFMVTAFLSMQCSGAHIHLAEHQDHGNNHHHYASQVHAHFVNDHHGNSLYTPSVTVKNQVIDISQKWANQGWSKLDDTPTLLMVFNFIFQSVPQVQYTPSVNTLQSQLAWLSYATIRSRAPPALTS